MLFSDGGTPKYSLMYFLLTWKGYRMETLPLQQECSEDKVDKPDRT